MTNGCLTITAELVPTFSVVSCTTDPVGIGMTAEYGSEVTELSRLDTVDLDVVLEALTIEATQSSDSGIDVYTSLYCPFISIRSFDFSFNLSFD